MIVGVWRARAEPARIDQIIAPNQHVFLPGVRSNSGKNSVKILEAKNRYNRPEFGER